MKNKEFLGALEEALEVPEGTLKPEATLDALGCWDSMAALVFMSLADQKLQLAISAADLQKCQTVQDLLGLLGNKITD
jgi:acyl carrier protein